MHESRKTGLLAVAPMMDCTDRHCRYFLRLLSRRTWLYTEMITTQAILRGNRQKLLVYDSSEHPLVLQLGGSEPSELQQCASIAADFGYDEINLNVGCPSGRVQAGRFGACLLKEPPLVAECVAAMKKAVCLPITVKMRIGVDDYDSYEHLHHFVTTVASVGCEVFIVHARKAWLKGLSPKENRTVPPLEYDCVYQLKRDFPHLWIMLNGGVNNLQQAQTHLAQVDGVMIGREAYHNPYVLADADQIIYDENNNPVSRTEVMNQYLVYAEQQLAAGVPFSLLSRPLIGLFQGLAGARSWRRHLTGAAGKEVAVIRDGMALMSQLAHSESPRLCSSRIPAV